MCIYRPASVHSECELVTPILKPRLEQRKVYESSDRVTDSNFRRTYSAGCVVVELVVDAVSFDLDGVD